ncbi:MAG: tetratricopeptide repeat protein [Bdellovibrionales bacterium]
MEEDPYVNEKLALKHDELAEMYTRYNRHTEALDQWYRSMNLSLEKTKYGIKIVDGLLKVDEEKKAIQLLERLIVEQPSFTVGRIRLGQIYYAGGHITKAIREWERVLDKTPDHQQASRLIREAQEVETTKMESTL